MKQKQFDPQEFFRIAAGYLPIFLENYKKDLNDGINDRKGIHLICSRMMFEYSHQVDEAEKTIGYIHHQKISDKIGFAREKITRSKKYRYEDTTGYITTFESENEAEKQFGGGVTLEEINYFIAGSGFPPDLDQQFILDVLTIMQAVEPRTIQRILEVSAARIIYWQRTRTPIEDRYNR